MGCMNYLSKQDSSVFTVSKPSTLFVGLLLIVIQFFDGLFTLLGVEQFGIEMEGNPMIRDSMEYFGSVPSLVFVKICCAMIIIHLVIVSKDFPWIRSALNVVACIYMLFAIVPWSIALSPA